MRPETRYKLEALGAAVIAVGIAVGIFLWSGMDVYLWKIERTPLERIQHCIKAPCMSTIGGLGFALMMGSPLLLASIFILLSDKK